MELLKVKILFKTHETKNAVGFVQMYVSNKPDISIFDVALESEAGGFKFGALEILSQKYRIFRNKKTEAVEIDPVDKVLFFDSKRHLIKECAPTSEILKYADAAAKNGFLKESFVEADRESARRIYAPPPQGKLENGKPGEITRW